MLEVLQRGGWFLPLNLALLVTAILMAITDMTVLLFHVMFVLLTLAAFFWEVRAFVVGAIFWVAVTSVGVIVAVYQGKIPSEEIIEIPLLTAILLIVFLIAQRRARVQSQVTELLATEQERAHRLRELAVLKADFSAMIAHELVSPLTALRVRAEMLERTELETSQAEVIAAMREDIRVLEGLVSDVQSAAKVEREDFALKLRRVALRDLLSDAGRFVDTLPGEHALIVESEVDGWVSADPERIGQVLRNLISNAARYSPEGVPIRLRATRTKGFSGSERIRIEVEDEGPGIHPDDLSRIFEKFGRGRDAEGRRSAGAGLGLYISERIVRAHGSELTVRSAPGEGSAFTLELDAAGDEPS